MMLLAEALPPQPHLAVHTRRALQARLPRTRVTRLALLVQAVFGVRVPVEFGRRLRLLTRPTRQHGDGY